WSQPAERLTLSTEPPDELQNPQQRPLGPRWNEFGPILRQFRATAATLALRFPEFTETTRIVDELLARGEAESRLAMARLTPLEFLQVRESLGFLADRPMDDRNRRPFAGNPNFTFVAATFRDALLNSLDLLTTPLPPAAATVAFDVSGSVQ